MNALDAIAAVAVCSVALRPEWFSVTVIEVDSLLESALCEYLITRRELQVQEVKRFTLLSLKHRSNSPVPAKSPREGMEVTLLGEMMEGEETLVGGQYCGVLFEGKVVVWGGITAQGAMTLKVHEGYGGRGYERGAARQLISWWRRAQQAREAAGAGGVKSEPHALIEEGDHHLSSTLVTMGFSPLSQAVSLQTHPLSVSTPLAIPS